MTYLKPNTNELYLTNIQKILFTDETLMRLLVYPPRGWDEIKQIEILDPLNPLLPNIVDDSYEYWQIVEDKVRFGSKRMQIENIKSAVLYMFEGTERPYFGNPYLSKKQVVFKIVVNEEFEVDKRISRISDRISHLIMRTSEVAGYGIIVQVGKNSRESPLGNRLQEDIYEYTVMTKANG